MIEKWKAFKIYTRNRGDNKAGDILYISNFGRIRRNDSEILQLDESIKYLSYSNYRVHRLVAEAFIPNPNNYNEVDHIDRNSHNNMVDNLRWVTHKENCCNRERDYTFSELHKQHLKEAAAKRKTNENFYERYKKRSQNKEWLSHVGRYDRTKTITVC